MLCHVWYDVIDPVGGDFGLFYAGDGSSNPAKFNNLCDFEIKKNCLGEPLLCWFALRRLATRWTLTHC